MSALGTTIPAEGETGTVTRVQHMPDQLPDNPATIAANTSLETLQQVMYSNWIWRNTFTIDASMQPGHVIGSIKIHPRNCNEYITHISKMFLTWTGAFKIRTRFMSTFQFGGSFRLGFLPPKFTQAQVNNLSIQTLTAYPNVDLDPKNTMWTQFQASDERNVLFHWMDELENDDPETFAGWFVFYVAAPLVVSGNLTSVSMLVEAAGSFDFSQLAPLGTFTPQQQGWLTENSTRDLLFQRGCDDWMSTSANAIQVFGNEVKSLPAGFTLANRVGSIDPPTTSTPGAVFSPEFQYFRDRVMAKEWMPAIATDITAHHVAGERITYESTDSSEVMPFNSEGTAMFTDAFTASAAGNVWRSEFKQHVGISPEQRARQFFRGASIGTTATVQGQGSFCSTNQGTPINVANIRFTNGTAVMPNVLPDESIVTFINLNARTVNLQTQEMALDFARVITPDPNISQLYQLFSESTPQPLMTLRFQPNGMITTAGIPAPAILRYATGQLYLRFLQTLPMTSPLPPSQTEARFLRYAQRCTTKGDDKAKYRMNLWSQF